MSIKNEITLDKLYLSDFRCPVSYLKFVDSEIQHIFLGQKLIRHSTKIPTYISSNGTFIYLHPSIYKKSGNVLTKNSFVSFKFHSAHDIFYSKCHQYKLPVIFELARMFVTQRENKDCKYPDVRDGNLENLIVSNIFWNKENKHFLASPEPVKKEEDTDTDELDESLKRLTTKTDLFTNTGYTRVEAEVPSYMVGYMKARKINFKQLVNGIMNLFFRYPFLLIAFENRERKTVWVGAVRLEDGFTPQPMFEVIAANPKFKIDVESDGIGAVKPVFLGMGDTVKGMTKLIEVYCNLYADRGWTLYNSEFYDGGLKRSTKIDGLSLEDIKKLQRIARKNNMTVAQVIKKACKI